MSWFTFLVISLAVWRIANMLVNEQGPSNIFEQLRYRAGVRIDPDNPEVAYAENPNSFTATLFLCLYCMSVWVAIPFFLLCLFWTDLAFILALIPAFSAVACLIGGRN